MKTLLGERLHFDWKIVTVIIVSTLLLIVDFYHQFTPNKDYDRTILYLLIPLLVVVLIFREDPRIYGLSCVTLPCNLITSCRWMVYRGIRSLIYLAGNFSFVVLFCLRSPASLGRRRCGCKPCRLRWRILANRKLKRCPRSLAVSPSDGSLIGRARLFIRF